jgi:hypothetical protein
MFMKYKLTLTNIGDSTMLLLEDLSEIQEMTSEEMSAIEGGWFWGLYSSYRLPTTRYAKYSGEEEEEEMQI